jgi:hypothetical protein
MLSLIPQNILLDNIMEKVVSAALEIHHMSFFSISPAVGQYKLPSAHLIKCNLIEYNTTKLHLITAV